MRNTLLKWSVCFGLLLTLSSPNVFAADKVKLSLWTHQRHMMDLLQTMLDEFNATIGTEKGIEVEMQVHADDATNVLLAAQKNNQGPDIYNIPTGLQGFEAEYEAGLKDYFDNMPGFAEWKKEFPEWYWRDGVTSWQGHVYAIPFSVYNAGIVYNKDLFTQAGIATLPKSYAEVREAAKKISQIEGKYGFAVPAKDNWFMRWMPSQLAEANGEPVWWDWKTGRYEFKNFQKIFQLILDMQQDQSLFPDAASLTNDALREQFAEGKIGMFLAENWDVGVLNTQFPAKNDWGVMPTPTFDGQFHGKTRAFMFAGLFNINGQCKHKEQAWEVVKFFVTYRNRARFYEEGKSIPADPEVLKYAKKQPEMKGFADFANALSESYTALFLDIPGFQEPSENPCNVLTKLLTNGGDLAAELAAVEKTFNDALDAFYAENSEIKREWNIYPNFDRVTGVMGEPALKK